MTDVRMPGVVDRHVHLGLVDPVRFAGSAVVEVHDLGWIPEEALALRRRGAGGARVRIAGPFLAPPGGYPSGRGWAPAASVRGIADRADAEQAIRSAVAQRFDLIKVTLHAGSPPFAPGVLEALTGAAHDAGLEVVAHAEGPGQALLALEHGVDALAHTPWSERLPDAVVAGMADRCVWISTLAIHAGRARRIAVGNARRFVAAGGRLRYGTDLGNGDWSGAIRRDEVLALGEAGLGGAALITALTGLADGPAPDGSVVVGAGAVPEDAGGIADWYLAARPAIVGA